MLPHMQARSSTASSNSENSKAESNESRKSAFMPCPICLEKIDNNNRRPATTICGHLFCETCIQRALQLKPYCPICRQYQKPDSNEQYRLNDDIPWNPQVVRAFFEAVSNERGVRRVCLSTGEQTNIFVDRNVGLQIDPNVNLVINGKRVENPSDCNQQ